MIRTSQTGLLGDLADGRLLDASHRGSGVPLGRVQVQPVPFAPAAADHELRDVRLRSGRRCRPRTWRWRSSGAPRRRRGARSPARARGDRTGPSRIATSGPRTPAADGRRRAGREARQPARSWASGAQVRRRAARSRAAAAAGNEPTARGGRAGARARGWTGGRIGPPAGPRTWRRCCAAWAAMVPRQSGLASAASSAVAIGARLRCQRAPLLGERDLRRAAAHGTGPATPGACARSAARCAASVPTSPRVIGPVSAARTPSARALSRVPSMSGP